MADSIDINSAPLHFSAEINDDGYEQTAEKIIQTNRRIYESELKRFNEGLKKQEAYNKLIREQPGAYKNLDRDSALQLASLQKLEAEMQSVAKAKADLNTAFSQGNISQKTYQESLSKMIDQELELAQAMEEVKTQLSQSASFQKASNDALTSRRSIIADLQKSYGDLTEAEKKTGKGLAISGEIDKLQQELLQVAAAFEAISNSASGDLAGDIQRLQNIRQEYAGIAVLQKELAAIPVKKAELNEKFAAQKIEAQAYREEVSKLTDQQQLLQTQIAATKASLKGIDAQFAQNQKKIAAETKELEKLKVIFQELEQTSPQSQAFKTTQSGMKKLESSIAAGKEAETKLLEQQATAAAKLTEQLERLAQVKNAKIELKTNFGPGAKYITEYHKALTELNTREQEITATIAKQTAAAQQNQAVLQATSSAIKERVAKVRELQKAYDALSDTDKANPEIGGRTMAEITGLQKQLNLVRNNIDSFPDLTLGGFEESVNQVNKLETRLDALIQKLTDIPAPDVKDNGELEVMVKQLADVKASLTDLPSLNIEGIRENTDKLLRLKETLSGLTDEEKTSIFGNAVSSEITTIEKELQRVDTLLTNLPEFTLGEIDSKKKQLAVLNAELDKLSDQDAVDINLGGKLKEQIATLNGQIDVLEKNVVAMPKLSIGDLTKQIDEVERLTKAYDALPEQDKVNPQIGGAALQNIQKLTAGINQFKAGLATIPDLVIGGIVERTKELNRLQEVANDLTLSGDTEKSAVVLADIQKLEGEIKQLVSLAGSVPEIDLGNIKEKVSLIANLESVTGKLKAELNNLPSASIQVQGVGELEKLIQKVSEAKAKLDSLPDSEKLDIAITGYFKQDIADLESSISRVIEKILNVPAFSLGNLEAEKAKVISLEKELQSLTDVDIAAGKGTKLTAEIDQAKAQVILLSKAVASVPELTLGNVQEKVSELVAFKNTVYSIKGPENFTIGKELQADIKTSLQSLDSLKAAVKDMPTLAVSGIGETVADLNNLQSQLLKLDQVKEQKIQLTNNFDNGDIAAYEAELAKLTQEENNLTQAIAANAAALQNNNSVQQQAQKYLQEQRNNLKALEAEYEGLSSADKVNLAIGVPALDDINRLKAEIAGLENVLTSFPEINLGSIQEKATQITKLKDSVVSLSGSISKMPAFAGTGELEALIKKATELKDKLTSLPADQQVDVNIGGVLSKDISELETSISRVVEKIVNLPELSLGNLDTEKKKLDALNNELEKFTDADIAAGKGDKLIAEIDQVEVKMKLLAGAIEAVPELTLGNVKEKIAELVRLQEQQQKLKGVALKLDVDSAKGEISNLNATIDLLKSTVTSLPVLSLGDVDKQTDEIQRLTKAFNALPEDQKLNVEVGGQAVAQIEKLTSELDLFKAGIKNIPPLVIEGIAQKAAELEKLQRAADDLYIKGEFDGNLLAEIQRVETEIKQLSALVTNIPEVELGQLKEKAAELARMREQLSGLSEVDLNGEIGANLKNGIVLLEKDLDAVKADILSLPDLQIDGIVEMSRELSRLKSEFEELTEDQKIDVSVGGVALSEIKELEAELQKFKKALASLPDFALKGIESRKADIQKLQDQLEAIPEGQQLELRLTVKADIDKLNGEINLLKDNVASVPELTLGSIADKAVQVTKLENTVASLTAKIEGLTMPNLTFQVQGGGELELLIKQATELKAKFEELPDAQKIDVAIGGKLTEELNQVDVQIGRVIEKILNLPPFSLGNLEEEKQKLATLEKQLESLSEADIKAGAGDKLITEIDQAESKVKLLSAAVQAVPELTLGNVQEKINLLIKLKQQQDNLTRGDIGTVNIVGVEQAVKNLEAFKTSLSRGITVPGIEEALKGLDKIQNQFTELANIKAAKLDLTNNFDKATGDVQEYEAALATLSARETELANSINEGAAALLKTDSIQQNAKENIEDTIAKLESLKLSYSQLSDQDKGSEKGLALAATIEKLKVEVEGMNTALKATGNGVTDETSAKIAGTVKLKNEYRDLLKVQKELSQVKIAKVELATDLKDGKVDAEAYGKALEKLEGQEKDLTQTYQQQAAQLRQNADFQKSATGLINQQEKGLIRLKAAYNNLPTSAKIDIAVGGEFKKEIDLVEQSIVQLKNIVSGADNLNFQQSTQGAQQFRKSIDQLQIEMQSYEAIVRKATDPAIIKKYSAEVEKLKKEIQQVGNAGAQGFDPMGRSLKEQYSIIGRLEKAAQLYKKAIDTATNPENIAKYNRKLQETEAQLARTRNAGKQGFDDIGNAVDKSKSSLGKIGSTAVDIAGAFGLVGLADTAVELAKKLFTVSVEASGVDRAFTKIGGADYLEKLRQETRGFVSDFELEKLTVKANNLKIPLKDIGTYLLFATQRANESGEAVEKLTGDIIEGLGKESLRIIDNLGISQKSVREEMKLGGTMAEAVGRIMRREMGESGEAVDTLADKVNSMSTIWSNVTKATGNFFSKLFNPDLADNEIISKKTQDALNQLNAFDFKNFNNDALKATIEDQIKLVAELDAKYKDALNTPRTDVSDYTDDVRKRAGEELAAAQNVLGILKKQNTENEKKLRISQGILTLAELEEKLAVKEDNYQNNYDPKSRANLKIEIDVLRNQIAVQRKNGNAEFAKLLNDVDVNFDKLVKIANDKEDLELIKAGVQNKLDSLAPDSKEIAGVQAKLAKVDKLLERYDLKETGKAAKLDNSSYEKRIVLLQKIAELQTKYNQKNLTPEELEIQQLRDEFQKITNEIQKYNRDPNNKIKLEIAPIKNLQKKVIAGKEYEQETLRLKIEQERQREFYTQYENFRTIFGKGKADERFKYEKAGFDSYVKFLENEISKITSLGIPVDKMTPEMKARLKDDTKALAVARKAEQESYEQMYIELTQDAMSYQEKVTQINEQYERQRQLLIDNNPGKDMGAEIAAARKAADAKIEIEKDVNFKKSALYKKLSKEIVQQTQEEINAQFETLTLTLKNPNLSVELREKLQTQLDDIKLKVKVAAEIPNEVDDMNAPAWKDDRAVKLDDQISKLKQCNAEIKEALEFGTITVEQEEALNKELKANNVQLKTAKEQRQAIARIHMGELAEGLGEFAGTLRDAASAMEKLNPEASNLLTTVGNLVSSGATLAAGFASMNPAQIFSGAVGIITQAYDLIDQSDEKLEAAQERRRASLEATNLVLDEMNRLLDQQGKQVDKALGTDKIQAFKNQLKLISKDIVDTIEQINNTELSILTEGRDGHKSLRPFKLELASLFETINKGTGNRPRPGGAFGGVITDLNTIELVLEANREKINQLYDDISKGNVQGSVEEIRKLIDAYEGLEEQLESYKARLREVITGTTFESIVDDIVGVFDQGFASAEERAKEFGENIKKIIRTALLQTLRRNALEIPIKDFYEQFAKAGEDGYSETEIADFTALYQKIIAEAEKAFAELEKIPGVDFTDTDKGNKNSLKGALSSASQESIDVLAGYTGAVRLLMIEQLEIQKLIYTLLRSGNTVTPGTLPESTTTGLDLVAAGNNTFSVPGMLEVASNTGQLVGTNQQIAQTGQEQVRIAMQSLDYQRQTADNTYQTAVNTTAIGRMATTLERIERNQSSGANALRASGLG